MCCLRVANTKAWPFPCLRWKITDVNLHKQGQVPGYEWTKRWNRSKPDPIQEWASFETRVIFVSEGYSSERLELHVRKFIPREGDKLERSWSHDGVKKAVTIPPFALVDIDHGRSSFIRYIRNSMEDSFPTILGWKHGIMYHTYFLSVEYCKASSTPDEIKNLLRDIFRLWMAIRLSTKSFFIVGEDTLGMPGDILDVTNPNKGQIPMPPVLGAQLDLILIHHIEDKLRRRVLEELERMVMKKQLNTWISTYVVTFILLHNTTLITAHDAAYARKHGIKVSILVSTRMWRSAEEMLSRGLATICPSR